MKTDVLNAGEDTQDLSTFSSELDQIREGLKLLGLKQCSCCRKYYKCPDGASLLDVGQLICYRCVSGWWEQQSPKLTVKQRRVAEQELARWLRTYHEGKTVRRLSQMPAMEDIKLKVVVGCRLCDGSGQVGASRCQNCDGRGTEWIVVSRV